MTDGMLWSAKLAKDWAEFAKNFGGDTVDILLLRLEAYFDSREIGILAAHFGSNAMFALSRTIETTALDEPTDPDSDHTDPDIEYQLTWTTRR